MSRLGTISASIVILLALAGFIALMVQPVGDCIGLLWVLTACP